MKILVATDGSTTALRALRFAMLQKGEGCNVAQITLLHVDVPLTAHITNYLDPSGVRQYHEKNSIAAMRGARRVLSKAGFLHDEEMRVGDAADEITSLARRGRFDVIAMGSHGRGALATALLGSVVQKVICRTKTPVLVVR
jgi:nucleotide-binding universal stress UspA family protein